MGIDKIIVAAFVIYAAVYIGRYLYRAIQGKKTGCGCGSEGGCPKKAEGGQAPEPK